MSNLIKIKDTVISKNLKFKVIEPKTQEFKILKENTTDRLLKLKGRINGNTYNAYVKSLSKTNKKDKIEEIITEISQFEKEIDNLNKINTVKNSDSKKVINVKLNKKSITEKKNITLVKNFSVQKFGHFNRDRYEYNNVNNLNDYWNAINKSMDLNPNATHITLLFKDKSNNSIMFRTIPFARFGGDLNVKNFLNLYETLVSREAETNAYGSDSVYNENVSLVLNAFDLSYLSYQGKGTSDNIMFNVLNIKSSKGECAYECLKACNIEYSQDKKTITDLYKLIEYIEINELPISIIANSFFSVKPINEIRKNKIVEIIQVEIKKKKIKIGCVKIDDSFITNNYINIPYLYTAKNSKYTIVYDEIEKHFDLCIDNKISFKNDLYFSLSCDVIYNGKVIMTPKKLNTNSFNKTKVNNRYLIFDYETIIDFENSSCMKEYSLSILNLNDEELEDLNRYDEEDNKEKIDEMRKKHCVTFLGYDCSKQFINWLLKNQDDIIYTFIGFNNSNFDNFILLNSLLEYNENMIEIPLTNIFYNGNQLISFCMNGRHNIFDIRKHLMGSLKKNCKDFNIKCCSKLDFDHNKAQMLYEDNKLLDFINDNEELKRYNEFDVLATAVLFCKYRKALKDIPATAQFADKLTDTRTIGSLIYKVFMEHKKKLNFELPKVSYEYYKDLQKSKIAGRVQLFNGIQKVEERLVSTDVCSLYPYVMGVLDVYYPCGNKIIEVDEYQGDEQLGFYYCDFNQSCLRNKNLPNIYAFKSGIENNWDHDGLIENYLLSNVMIGLMLKYGVDVTIKKGFVFTEKKKSCEMFGFLLDFMSAKNTQDTLKKNKDNTYNSALRETFKLLMNSLSGKVIEGLHTEKTVMVDNVIDYNKIKSKMLSSNVINSIGNKLFITYEQDAEEICEQQQRPIYLGILIYDYAKRYMYENSYSKVGLNQLLYTDTDASKFRYSKFLDWKNWVNTNNVQVPHWKEVEDIDERYRDHKIFESDSKVFGSFEDELEDMIGENYTFYCLEKKSWLYDVDGDSKYRFKGINGSAQILTLEEDFIDKIEINHKAKNDKEAFTEIKYRIKEDNEKEVYTFYNNNKKNEIDCNNQVNFFEKLYSEGHAYVLVNSFRKIVKNTNRNVTLEQKDKYNNLMNSIQVNFMIKHLSLKR